jgi:hypothetical protein
VLLQMSAADWLRLSCRVVGRGVEGGEGTGMHLSLSLSTISSLLTY